MIRLCLAVRPLNNTRRYKVKIMPDAWQHLRQLTSARIALGRAGGSLPTVEVLKFSMDHALARDAVWAELDVDQLRGDLTVPIIGVSTMASDRATYLQRPDYGRRLSPEGVAAITNANLADRPIDVAIIIADGLSALAA